ANGTLLTGYVEIYDSGDNDYNSHVAMLPGGNFVVSWTQDNATGRDVLAATCLGGYVTPLNLPMNPMDAEEASSISSAPDGRFVIAYQRTYQDGDTAIYAAQYNAQQNYLGYAYINNPNRWDTSPSVSMDRSGRFVVAWNQFNGDNWDIKARRYSS